MREWESLDNSYKANIELRWLTYSFSGLLNYHHGRDHGSVQAYVVLELRALTSWLTGNRNSTDSVRVILSIQNLKACPHSDTHPPEGLTEFKRVPSILKVWIKGICHPAFSNRNSLPPTRPYLLIMPLYEYIGAKYIQTTRYINIFSQIIVCHLH